MLKSQRYLCLGFGAGSVKAAEFETNPSGGLILKQHASKALGIEGTQDSKREKAIETAVQQLLANAGFTVRTANICAPGFQVFSKFIKLPPVDTAKVRQIIQYEAQQNIPYPIEEAVWEFQIMGTAASGDIEVLLVAMKANAVEALFRSADKSGLKLNTVDTSIAALTNAFRYNYGDPDQCAMLLDIGAKTSNVILFEKGKVFARSINIGANAITQDFVAESKIPFAKAEELKLAEGFVGLGGAYEEPESPHQAAISKIARQVLTRLHIQVNQTIQFYRAQLGGSAPVRLYLAGAGASMTYTPEFFAEKLNIGVEYFNPFRNITVDAALNLEQLAKVAHTYGEVVGLALRNLAQCPVELNLIPKSIRNKQLFQQKRPYFIATMASLILVVFAIGLFYNHVIDVKRQTLADLTIQLKPLQHRAEELEKQEQLIKSAYNQANLMTAQMRDRFFWPEALVEMRSLLLKVEDRFTRPGHDVGVWIEHFGTADPGLTEEENAEPTFTAPVGSIEWIRRHPELAKRYFPDLYKMLSQSGILKNAVEPEIASKPRSASTNNFTINVKFRAVQPNNATDPAANGRLAFAVADEFKKSPYFDPDGTKLSSDMEESEPFSPQASAFRFNMVLKLRNEMQF
jgi:type IV pilus assembly protein PilM